MESAAISIIEDPVKLLTNLKIEEMNKKHGKTKLKLRNMKENGITHSSLRSLLGLRELRREESIAETRGKGREKK